MANLPTTETEFDQNLNRLDSILQGLGVHQETRAGDIVGGVFGSSGSTNGVEFGVNKTTNLSYLQSRNFISGSTGWRLLSDGTAELVNLVASGYISVGGAAADVNAGATTISGGKITTNTIAANAIITGQLIVGTNVGLGTAQNAAGVTTIIGDTVTTSYLNAKNITALGAVTSGSFAIGTNAWHVDSSGNMWWGNFATYAAATYKISTVGVANLSGIIAASVAAENITGTTITGKIFQTHSAAAAGIKIQVGDYASITHGYIELWNDYGDAVILYSHKTTGNLHLEGGDLISWGDIKPGASGRDLGGSASANKWQDLYLSRNIIVGGTVDGVDIASHAGDASAHHSYLSDNLSITPANVDIKADGYIKRAGASVARLTSLGFDMYVPLGLRQLSSPPGAASTYQGFMYYDTTQVDIVFSNGTNWYKVNATAI